MTDLDDGECRHGLDIRWCSLCLRPEPRLDPPPVAVEVRSVASYAGQCPVCDLPIYPGQRITRLSTGRWVHARGCEP